MDVSPIVNAVYGALWYLIPIALLVGLLKSPWFKGVLGEFQVNLLLKLFLPKERYHLIKNVTLPTDDGTTQIDHILVSQYGVFVIETKNMKGWIFGSAKQAYWTQKIFKYSNKFQNPLRQNYKHLKTLEACLDVPAEGLFSVIVFIGDSTFKTAMPDNVTYAMGCVRYIKSKTAPLYSNKQVTEIVAAIESGRLERGFKTNREHASHVNGLVQEKAGIGAVIKVTSKPVAKTVKKACPKCGAGMVVREAKRGRNVGSKFWGCESFPKCRGVVRV